MKFIPTLIPLALFLALAVALGDGSGGGPEMEVPVANVTITRYAEQQNVELSWASHGPCWLYDVQTSDDSPGGPWFTQATLDGGQMEFPLWNDLAGEKRRFYRVVTRHRPPDPWWPECEH